MADLQVEEKTVEMEEVEVEEVEVEAEEVEVEEVEVEEEVEADEAEEVEAEEVEAEKVEVEEVDEVEAHIRKLLKEGTLDDLLHVLMETRDAQCVLAAAMLFRWMSHARLVLSVTGRSGSRRTCFICSCC